ncbi:MAG TPA: restriction endonuclease subunit S [Gammaproteobacteria bacterium]|nr:restriction endonuclease subunit S [Gammaproteobacteria bacterium]
MNNTWQIKKLADICEVFTDGDWIEKKDQSFDGIRLIQTGNIGNSVFKEKGEKARYISEATFKKLRCTEIFPDDCLISRLPDPIGRSCIIPHTKEPMITAVDCTILRFHRQIILPTWFIYYTLSQEYQTQINKQISGATRQRISRHNLGLIEIPVPNITEQRHILTILDIVFSTITKAKAHIEKNLLNTWNVFESELQNTFKNTKNQWQEKTLKQISSSFGRGKSKHRPRNDKKLYGGNYPFIQTGDIRNSNHYISQYTQTYNEIGLAQSKLWPKGTICITIAANIAETGILEFDACFPDSVIGLVVNPDIAETDFVEYLLQSFKSQLQSKGKGSAQDNINLATFEHELFPIPSIPEQHRIVKKLNLLAAKSKKLESIYQQKLTCLEELKKSILQKAYSGKLTSANINIDSQVQV